jgi:NADH-quinone oxidoreductase subunit G
MQGVLNDSDQITVIQIAPAVRASWGEEFGLSSDFATEKRLVAALKRMGFNYVFDTNFSADLTIMEEGTEFLGRLKNHTEDNWPMFTSCCPGWVRFIKSQYPELVDHLSTAKSPQQMFGTVAKTYFAEKIGVDPKKIKCISVMPCLAKKEECNIPNINDSGAGKDVDYVLTTREICRMIKFEQIDVTALPEEEFDFPLGSGSGAAVIFGATGGVMEAALRTCYAVVTGKNPEPDAFKCVRGAVGLKESEFVVAGTTLKIAVVSGLANARKLLEDIKLGKSEYDFVEVMACPGGCSGGGGQPIHDSLEMASTRWDVLYQIDSNNDIRFSHENPEIQVLYNEFLGKPNSHKAHELLHTDHHGWNMPS